MHKYDFSTCPLFIGLPKDEIDEIITHSIHDSRTFDKGSHVVRQGDPINYLYLMVDGRVRMEMITIEGNIVEMEILDPIRPLAPAFIFATKNRFPVDVIAMEKSIFYRIEKSVWMTEMMRNKTLLTNFLKLNSNMTVFLSDKVQMISIKSLKGKLALYILENTSAKQDVLILKRSQTQLSEYFGVQRPSLARTIGELVHEKIISLDKRELRVLDRQKLEELI